MVVEEPSSPQIRELWRRHGKVKHSREWCAKHLDDEAGKMELEKAQKKLAKLVAPGPPPPQCPSRTPPPPFYQPAPRGPPANG